MAASAVVLLAASAVRGQPFPNDFQIWRLGNPQSDGAGASPSANGNFRVFARQLAAVLTSTNGMAPSSLGHSAFALSVEGTYYFVDTKALPTANEFAGATWFPSLHLRKGLPFSFEIGARGSYLPQSRMGAAGLELKWAVNEGLRSFPDICVRGFVTKLINSRDFDLTAGGFDLGIGKQLTVAGMMTLTPYGGFSLVFVGATTGSIDFRPNRTLAEADAEPFRDYYVFEGLPAGQNTHNRVYGGLRLVGGHFTLNAEASYSVFPVFRDARTGETRSIPGVLALTGSFGIQL
jgi:hypothetical protein